MPRKHVLILVFGLVVAAAVGVYLVALRGSGPTELELIQQLLQASINKHEVIATHKVKQVVARGRAKRICAEAVELWAAYAHRCSRQSAAEKETLRAAVREAAQQTLGCQRIWQVGEGEAIDRCFAFLMSGSCQVLRTSPEALRRALGGSKAKRSARPPAYAVCLGVF